MGSRQIVHIDMDAFYASVEQRDDPRLKGKPVVVAWRGPRSVVCAASYEARQFGIRSAMPSVTAERLCAEAVFIAPDFTKYREVSRAIREIFATHTDLIEPLSLDEAYLDVTTTKCGLKSGLEVAMSIRAAIKERVALTASAGIAPNKFLSKIASDHRKPDGLFEIKPNEVLDFLAPLPVGRLPGVGKVTEERLAQFAIKTVADLRKMGKTFLKGTFGSGGLRLLDLANCVDESEVVPDRPTKSISAEDTFEKDLPLEETKPILLRLAERVWESAQNEERVARTVVLKLKTSNFNVITRSHTPPDALQSAEDFVEIATWLHENVDAKREAKFRLIGVGLSNFVDSRLQLAQPALF
jgi:DNA polymerase-4